jgi:ABC-type proline/glycine betaine transport system ATPase subunit
VLKNVSLPMLFVGIDSDKADIEARKLLERLNLKDQADKYPYELSGGQQQRVGIARALANNPPIIIADEPLGNLDSVNAQLTLEFLKELNEKDGRTVIMVTHEKWSLRDVKTIFHMKDGVIESTEKTKNNPVVKMVESTEVKQKKEEEEKLSARVLANFLLRGYSMDEIKRFESFVNERFDNKLDKKEFSSMVHKSFKDGGIGLYKQKAQRVSEYLESIIEKRRDIEHIYSIIGLNPELPVSDEIHNIRKWLLEGYRGEVSQLQAIALDQVISDRIRDYIPANKVVEILDLSNSKFGVGLSFRAAQLMAEKLELILNDNEEAFDNTANGNEFKKTL